MQVLDLVLMAALAGAWAVLSASDSELPLDTVPHVDLERYAGRWFEIARYPNRFEKKCDRDVTAEYSIQKNGTIRVVNACLTRTGEKKASRGTATVVDTATNAKLKVSFFWPFYGKYWIIDLDDDYKYAAVGEPSRQYLWILSRTPAMPDETYRKVLLRLSAMGYEARKLIKTVQTATGNP